MIKKSTIVCCFMIICSIFFTACMWDPYSDKRPFDYGNAEWICSTDAITLWFDVDTEQEEYYYPEGGLILGDTTYFCKYWFIHQTNRLIISVYPWEYKDIPDENRDNDSILFELDGDCDFSSDLFTFNIDTSTDDIFNGTIDKLTFIRTESENDS